MFSTSTRARFDFPGLLRVCMPQFRCLRKQKINTDLVSYTLSFKYSVSCSCICTHLPPCRQKPTSDVACSVHTPWWRHGQHACSYFGQSQVSSSFGVCVFVNQWHYNSAISFWVTVLFVHHHCVYSCLWVQIHSSYLPSLTCMPCPPACHEDTQSSLISPPCEGFPPACAFLTSHTRSPAILTCPAFPAEKGIRLRLQLYSTTLYFFDNL